MEDQFSKYIEKNRTENTRLLLNSNKCDKYDYLIAAACGAIGGMIDIFFVGAPGDSTLGKWTDTQVDNVVKAFARKVGWNPKEAKKGSVASAIGFLETKFKVNYDQRYTADVGNLFIMNTKNHHLLSLSHSPDVIGLFFSILNQFTSTSSFIANGRLITIATDTFELQGGNFVAKIFCGIANWFGHIMSDIAGSSGSRGNDGRGTGVAMPFYELFQFCKFGKFSVGRDKQDFAVIAERAFKEGYDFRFGLTMTIPLIITDLSIRLIWAIRRYFQYGKMLKECVPTSEHSELRVMLLLGNGVLCVMDGTDAAIRSGGNFLIMFTRLNLVAWYRFVSLVIKEICIRLGLKKSLQNEVDAFRKVNEAIVLYLNELERIDIEAYKNEADEYLKYCEMLSNIESEQTLNSVLLSAFEKFGICKPWNGELDEFMSNKDNHLVYE